MRMVRSPRFLVWLACVLALAATYAADRSPGSMADAATKFLATLSPEQRKVATFAFESTAEREHFGFVPSEMFPRNGLTIGAMSEPQRKAAHDLLKIGPEPEGLHDRDGHHGARERPQRDREPARRRNRSSVRSSATR